MDDADAFALAAGALGLLVLILLAHAVRAIIVTHFDDDEAAHPCVEEEEEDKRVQRQAADSNTSGSDGVRRRRRRRSSSPSSSSSSSATAPSAALPTTPVPWLVVIGSGGHTSEMMSTLAHLTAASATSASSSFASSSQQPQQPQLLQQQQQLALGHLTFVLADTDETSESYVRHRAARLPFLQSLPASSRRRCHDDNDDDSDDVDAHFTVRRIPRSREVRQSLVTSCFTTLRATAHALALARDTRPRVLLVNGPGTCLPVVVAVRLLSLLQLTPPCSVVFIESVCRVRSLSLAGALLYHARCLTRMLVQWPELRRRYGRTEYAGRLA